MEEKNEVLSNLAIHHEIHQEFKIGSLDPLDEELESQSRKISPKSVIMDDEDKTINPGIYEYQFNIVSLHDLAFMYNFCANLFILFYCNCL